MLLYPDLRRVGVPPESWLGNRAAALALTFDVDAESNLLSRSDHYLEHLATVSHQQYGPRIGVPRLIAMLAQHNAPATFYVPGIIVERWPETVDSILEAGHEVALHGYKHLSPVKGEPKSQREEIERGIAALSRFGVTPKGYRAPGGGPTILTLQLLLEYGLVYDSSLTDDDRPYVLATQWGRLAELPVHASLDDWSHYIYMEDPAFGDHIASPRQVAEIWSDELEAMRTTHSLLTLVCHPLVSGRPSRVRAVEQLIEFAQDCGDVVFRRCDELATTVLAAEPHPYTSA